MRERLSLQVLILSKLNNKFSLIVPETGVTIIEGDKKKIGDKDFFHKYNKFSKYDYNSMIVIILY